MALPQPSTLYSLNCQCERSKSSSGPLFHIRNGLCVCQFWVSWRMKRERQRGGEKTTYGVYDECRRGQYMFSVMMGEWGILEDTHTVSSRGTHTHRHSDSPCLTCVAQQMHQNDRHQLFNPLGLGKCVSACVCAHVHELGSWGWRGDGVGRGGVKQVPQG